MTVEWAEFAARMFEAPTHDWATPGDLARAIEPSTIQTKALDLIDEYLVKVESGEIDRLIVNLPPQEGKSTRVTTIGPLWFLTRNPERRIAIVSYAQDLADEFGRNIRNHIASNDGDEADEGEDGHGTVWVDVLPDMTKFREAFSKAAEDLSISVTVDATIDLDDTDPLIKRNREAIQHELRHPLGDRFKCGHPLCYLPTAGCPCGETH